MFFPGFGHIGRDFTVYDVGANTFSQFFFFFLLISDSVRNGD